jgi:hypothetical protein
MEKLKTPEEQLDYILECVRNNKLPEIFNFDFGEDEVNRFESFLNYLDEEKLIKRKFIKPDLWKQEYVITPKGLIFEGYVNQKNRLQREKLLQSLPIWVTAIGTGLSGLYVLGKLFLWLCGY